MRIQLKEKKNELNNLFNNQEFRCRQCECECSPPAEGKEKKRLGPRREDDPLKDEKSSKREKEWKRVIRLAGTLNSLCCLRLELQLRQS